jgi:hypothetical protein
MRSGTRPAVPAARSAQRMFLDPLAALPLVWRVAEIGPG